MEATGGFELLAAVTLAKAGRPLAVVSPRQVRDIAKAMGRLAKTDALDAALLADFAQRVRPEPRPLPDDAAQLLERLLTRRRQIVDMLTAEKNRLGVARARAATFPSNAPDPRRVPASSALPRLVARPSPWCSHQFSHA